MADKLEIVLDVEEREAVEATRRANAALDDLGKKGDKAASSAEDALRKQGERVVGFTDRSRRSIDRIVSYAEGKAASAGLSRVEQLKVEQARQVKRVAGDARAVEKVNASYAKMIRVQAAAGRSSENFGRKFTAALRNPRGALDSLTTKLGTMPLVIGGTIAAVGALGLATFKVVRQMTDWEQSLRNTSQILGLTRRETQLLQFATKESGLDTTVLTQVMKGFARVLEDTTEESRRGRMMISELGVTISDTDGRVRNTKELFLELADALSDLEPSRKLFVLQRIFSEAGAQALPLFDRNLRTTLEDLEKLGIGLDEDLLGPLSETRERLDRLSTIWEDTWNRAKATFSNFVASFVSDAGKLQLGELGMFLPGQQGPAVAARINRRIEEARPEPLEPPRFPTREDQLTHLLEFARGFDDAALEAELEKSQRRVVEFMENNIFGIQNTLRNLTIEQRDALLKVEAGERGELSSRAAEEAIAGFQEVNQKIEAATKRLQELQGAPARAAKQQADLDKFASDLEKRRQEQRREGEQESTDFAISELERLHEADKRLAEERLAFTEKTGEMRRQLATDEVEARFVALDRARDQQLGELGTLNAKTLDEKVALEGRKLEIEIEYLQRSEKLQLAGIRRQYAEDVEEARRSGASREAIEIRLALLRESLSRQEVALQEDIAAAISGARGDVAARQSEMIRNAHETEFARLQDSVGSLYDALTTRSENFGRDLANAVRLPMLAALKEIVTSQVARMLAGLFGVGGGGGGLRARFAGGGGLLGLAAPLFGGFGSPGAPGGTGGFAGPVQSIGQLGSGGFGGTGGVGGLLGQLGNLGGPKTYFDVDRGLVTTQGSGVGGVAGGAMLAGGGSLLAAGLQRGGKAGVGMSAAGGALIGAKFGGPLGAAIGGIAGAAAGLVRTFYKGAVEKARLRIREAYDVNIRERRVLEQVVEISRSMFGGNLRVAIQSDQVRELVQLYAISTDEEVGAALGGYRPTSFVQSGGALASVRAPVSGSALSGTLQPTGGQQTVVVQSLSLHVDGQGAADVLEGRVAPVIARSGREIQDASLSAQRSNSGRRDQTAMLLAPGHVPA